VQWAGRQGSEPGRIAALYSRYLPLSRRQGEPASRIATGGGGLLEQGGEGVGPSGHGFGRVRQLGAQDARPPSLRL
jgi:hypothetical protein